MKKITYILLAFLTGIPGPFLIAQEFELSGQIRPRYEMRNGFNTLKPDSANPANFISQRSRINFKYANELFRFKLSIQNIGVWGETVNVRLSDVNGTMIHEAWAALIISPKVSLKMGRQMLIYDDDRIFGSLDWAQQARSHDALLLSVTPRENCKLDVGFAYNANRQSLFKEIYAVNQYKTLQFAHWHRDINSLGISVLFLNNGVPWIDRSDTTETGTVQEKIAYSQTMGTRLTYKKNKLNANGAFYYQTGKVTNDSTGDGVMESTRDFNALNFRLEAGYEVISNFTLGAGFEYMSGNSMKDPSENDEAFKPFYGTNHIFNGLMDYFYVGNHFNSVGLMDLFLKFTYARAKYSLVVAPHLFNSAADVYGTINGGALRDFDSHLGTEIDVVFTYAFAENVVLKAGYSQMFATESMQVLKGGNYENTQNWAWVMIDFKPTFFKSEK
jgi:hypothetical protein